MRPVWPASDRAVPIPRLSLSLATCTRSSATPRPSPPRPPNPPARQRSAPTAQSATIPWGQGAMGATSPGSGVVLSRMQSRHRHSLGDLLLNSCRHRHHRHLQRCWTRSIPGVWLTSRGFAPASRTSRGGLRAWRSYVRLTERVPDTGWQPRNGGGTVGMHLD